MRISEILSLRPADLKFTDGFLSIRVRSAKNDQLAKGAELKVAASAGPFCPVSTIKQYLDLRRGSGDWLFPDSIHPTRPLSYNTARALLRFEKLACLWTIILGTRSGAEELQLP